jgi:hypothetical protein
MSNWNYKQVTNVTRRTWDRDTYEQRAKERTQAASADEAVSPSGHRNGLHPPPPSSKRKNRPDGGNGNEHDEEEDDAIRTKPEFQPAVAGAAGPYLSKRAFLTARRGKVDVDSKIGSVEIINPDAVATISTTTTVKAPSSGAVSIKVGVVLQPNTKKIQTPNKEKGEG